MTKELYKSAVAHLLFLAATAGLTIYGAVHHSPAMLYGAWGAFLVWDFVFFITDQIGDRTADSVLVQIGDTRTNLSWYVVVFAASIAGMATGKDAIGTVTDLFKAAEFPKWIAMTPLVAASIGVLFIPIKKSNVSTPISTATSTNSLRSMIFICAFLQKITVTSFVFSAVWLGHHILK